MRHVGGTVSCEGLLLTWDGDIPLLFVPNWKWGCTSYSTPLCPLGRPPLLSPMWVGFSIAPGWPDDRSLDHEPIAYT